MKQAGSFSRCCLAQASISYTSTAPVTTPVPQSSATRLRRNASGAAVRT